MRRLVPRLTCRGLMDEALEAAGRAVELLEPLPPGRELGSALAAMAQLYLSVDDLDRAIEWGRRAAVIAAEFDDSETSVEVAITVGTAEFWRDGPARSRGLEQALELAQSEGVEADVPRALNNLAWAAVAHRAHPAADRWIAEGLAYSEGHDLDLWRLSILSARVRSELNQGRWTDAIETAELLIADLRDSPGPRAEALLVLALVRARRGDPGAARGAVGGQRDRAPGADLGGSPSRPHAPRSSGSPAVRTGSARRRMRRTSWHGPVVAVVARRTRLLAPSSRARGRPRPPLPDPIALEIEGRHRDAAAAWQRLGCPYESAVVLGLADDSEAVAEAHDRLRKMGRRPRGRDRGPAPARARSSRDRPRDRVGRRGGTPPTSRPASSMSSRWWRTASATPRSPSACSSRPGPSTTTCRRSCASSMCPAAAGRSRQRQRAASWCPAPDGPGGSQDRRRHGRGRGAGRCRGARAGARGGDRDRDGPPRGRSGARRGDRVPPARCLAL